MASEPRRSTHFVEDIIERDNRSLRWGVWPDGTPKVHTRFPPEPNGYLHIGHAKSICLNFGLAEQYGGKCNLRFDDTNPVKEEEEYVRSIVESVRWLGFRWPGARDDDPLAGVLFASDYFQQMYDWAAELVRKGVAYVDDQTAEEIRAGRGTLTRPGRNSPFRDRPADENLDLFERMRRGEFPDGSRVLRARIDMASPNLNLRDPVMVRILHASHHRTGDAWCLYPMYDWAHGLEDSIEGITHSICTLEFENHRPLYDWFIDAINQGRSDDGGGPWGRKVHHPQQIEFARLELTHTVMSKRRLLELVRAGEEGARMRNADCGLRNEDARRTNADGASAGAVSAHEARREPQSTIDNRQSAINPQSAIPGQPPSGAGRNPQSINGWDDPRLPTLAGLRRRGYTPEAIRAFCADVGVAKFNSVIDVVRLENAARDHLNRTAPRVMAVLRPLKMVITNWPDGEHRPLAGAQSHETTKPRSDEVRSTAAGESKIQNPKSKIDWLDAVNNPEDPAAGTRKVPFGRVLYIERDDFMETPPPKYWRLFPGNEVRLRYAYFVKCTGFVKDSATGEVTEVHCTYDPATRGGDAPDGRKVKATLHWVSAEHALPVEVRLYDHLFTSSDPDEPSIVEQDSTSLTGGGPPAAGATGSPLPVPAADWRSNLNPDSLEVVCPAYVEPSVASVAPGSRYQFERLGYFCVDPDSTPERLVFDRTVTLKDAWAKIAKK